MIRVQLTPEEIKQLVYTFHTEEYDIESNITILFENEERH